MSERKHYIDNLRWFSILILIPFHAAMAWNGWEDNYVWYHENKVLSSIVIFISPYFMPLLFVLAGMSTKYALQRRNNRQYIIERVKKLFLPLATGLFTVAPFMAYIADKYHNKYKGGFISHYRVFFTHVSDMTGYDGYFTTGHLWFLIYLFIISLISLGIISLQKRKFNKLTFSNIPAFILPFLLVFPLAMIPILNIGGKSMSEDFALFLLGYYILSEEKVLEKVTKYSKIYLFIMFLCDSLMTYLFVWKDQGSDLLLTACQICSLWFGVLGLIGIARLGFNHNNKVTRYFTTNSFLIYIFHFGWLVWIQYLLSKTNVNDGENFAISVVGTLILTILTCEIVRRIPGIRFLFGIKFRKKIVQSTISN